MIFFRCISALQASLTDTLFLFFQSVRFINSLDFGYYKGFIFVIVFLLILAGFVYLVYITVQTILMKKDMAMMSTVINEEGEVVEILDEYGKKGWIFIYGENWRFKSEKPVKIGDTVRVINHKKMHLFVEKAEDF